jgi:hypothetical protein
LLRWRWEGFGGEVFRRYEVLVMGGRGETSGRVSAPWNAGGRFPAPDMSRLVGVKLPKGAW